MHAAMAPLPRFTYASPVMLSGILSMPEQSSAPTDRSRRRWTSRNSNQGAIAHE
jgi:hypothetical protein